MNIAKDLISQKIKELRTLKGVSQEELGKALGRSHAAISDIERGKTNLSVQDLSAISNFFQTPLSYFIEGQYAQLGNFNQHRYSKDISPIEKRQAEKVSLDFDKYVKDILDQEDKSNE